MSIITRTGKKCWDRSMIWGMLKNPTYKGQAAFVKTKVGIKLQHIRPQKHSCEQPKDNYSTYSVEKANWIYVKVPNIVNEDVFDIVQEQLAENRKIARTRERGAKHLLQGLIVCKRCRYAYYGSSVRTCSQSFQKQSSESKNDHLQASVEFPLAIFPKSPTFLQPGKRRSLNNPSFWQYSKGV